MASTKLTRKQLKEPDEFMTTSAKALDWARANMRQIGAVAGGFVAVTIAVWALTSWSEHQAVAAATLYNEAVEIQQWKDPGTPSGDGEDGAPPPKKKFDFASEAEQTQAALDKFLEVIEKYPRDDLAHMARYHAGMLSYRQGKREDAEKHLATFAGDEDAGTPFAALAHETLGYLREAAGDRDGARKHFTAIAESEDALYAEVKLLHEARLAEAAGDKEAARTALKKIVDDFAESPVLRQAEARLALLDSVVLAQEPPPKQEAPPAVLPDGGAAGAGAAGTEAATP